MKRTVEYGTEAVSKAFEKTKEVPVPEKIQFKGILNNRYAKIK